MACRKSLDLGSCKTWTWNARPIPFRAHGATPLHTLPHCGYFCSRQEWAKHGITFHRFLKAVCVLEPPLTRSIDWDKQGCWHFTLQCPCHTHFSCSCNLRQHLTIIWVILSCDKMILTNYKVKYWKWFWNDCQMNILLLRWQMLKVSKIKRIYKTKLRKYKFTRVRLIWFAIILVFVKFVVWSHSNLNTKVSVLSTVKLKHIKQDKGKNEQQLNPRSADKTSLSALLPTNLHVLHVQTNTPAERRLTVGLISRNHVNKPT